MLGLTKDPNMIGNLDLKKNLNKIKQNIEKEKK